MDIVKVILGYIVNTVFLPVKSILDSFSKLLENLL